MSDDLPGKNKKGNAFLFVLRDEEDIPLVAVVESENELRSLLHDNLEQKTPSLEVEYLIQMIDNHDFSLDEKREYSIDLGDVFLSFRDVLVRS